jgi:Flp pilus assembly protein protease CpaA
LALIDVAVLFVSGLSAFLDFRIRKIPNWLILIGLFFGLLLNAIAGGSHLLQSILGIVVGVSALLVPFACGWIGAGDVKFFGVIGGLLGVNWLPRVFFYSALVAGLIACGYTIVGSARFSRFAEMWLDLRLAVVSLGSVLPKPVQQRTLDRSDSVPWGVAFAAGTIIAYYFDRSGKWAGF